MSPLDIITSGLVAGGESLQQASYSSCSTVVLAMTVVKPQWIISKMSAVSTQRTVVRIQ